MAIGNGIYKDRASPPLSIAAILGRLAAIGLVLLALVAAFAYVAGWLSPSRLTQARLMDGFRIVNGDNPGFRRNHAKGVCVSGWFEGNGEAVAISKAEIFRPGRVALIGRFALAGGMPAQSDTATAVRSMALRFMPSRGGEWRTGMNNIPVFPVNTAQGFYDQLLASKSDPATGKPDPAAMQRFLAAHPEATPALELIKQRVVSTGFADSTFNSLDAFRSVDASGRSTAVRWATVPMQTAAEASAPDDRNYLFDQLIAQIHQHPLKWHFMVTVGQPGDPTADATMPWPPDRPQIDAGTVTIDAVSSEDTGACTDINFDPLVLPAGIEPSDDPLLSARSAAYARSFTLRATEKEKKRESAVTASEIRVGRGS